MASIPLLVEETAKMKTIKSFIALNTHSMSQ